MHLCTQTGRKPEPGAAETARPERPSRPGLLFPAQAPALGAHERTERPRRKGSSILVYCYCPALSMSGEIAGCGSAKCTFCLSHTWLVPVKSGGTGSGKVLSRSSPIKFVEFMTQRVLISFCLFNSPRCRFCSFSWCTRTSLDPPSWNQAWGALLPPGICQQQD